MPKYLNADGVRLMIQTLMESIKEAFTLKSDAVKSIRRNGTTFTATRADGTTFTFDQQDASVEKSSTTPLENGTAAVGDENKYAAGNHVHPHDSTKVDKVDGKGLSSNDYTSAEKEKLSELPTASDLSDALGQKVNKVAGKGLSSNDYTSEEKSKLGSLPTSAELTSSMDNKVDKASGKGLSTNDYTTEEKNKLGSLPTSESLTASLGEKVDKASGKGLSTNDFTNNHKTKLESLPDNETLSKIYAKKNLDSKTFTGVIGTAANWANATFFFGTIYPESYYATWKIQYRIYAEAAGSDESKAIADVTVSGTQSKMISYSSFNSIANTSYRPAYDHELYRATSDGYEAGYGHALGVRLYSSWQPANPVNARTFSIDILSAENCEFEFYDSMMLYADIPGTGSTNYSDYSELNFLDNGLQETGDTNQVDRLQVPTASWLAGTNGLKAYGLFMQDADGAYQSFTLTNGTAATKAKNPVGFVPGKVWYMQSSANVAAGSSSGAGVGYISYPFDFRYSSNCASTLTNGEPVYIVFTEGNDGLVYLADVWWTQSLPTTEDGYVYMYLGQVYANGRSIHLSPFHPMYKFYDGAVREWFPGMRRTATSSSDGLMSASDKAKLDSITPLRMNNGVLEYYDGTAWAAVPLRQ